MQQALPPRPNIVFVLSDDQGYWAAGPYGNTEVLTPNLDALAHMGITFDRMYCASPVCSPSRASILTGRIPSAHGVHDWIREGNTNLPDKRLANSVLADKNSDRSAEPEGPLYAYLEGLNSYTAELSRNGYRCGCYGKWHLGNAHLPQQGFRDWFVHPHGGGPYYDSHFIDHTGAAEVWPGYVTEVITDHALGFLDSLDPVEPFYLSVHYTAPHSPWGRDQHPHELWDRYYEDCPFESVPDLPIDPLQINTSPAGFDTKDRRAILAGYYAAIESMDQNIGRIQRKLEEMGQLENTLFVFTSDNGMNMGHHGLYGKGNASFPLNMFETSVRVPCIISHPTVLAGNRRIDELTSHYDLFPTFLEYTGIDLPEDLLQPGESLLPLLVSQTDAVEREVLVIFSEYGPVHMVCDQRWKYVHRYPYGSQELYDLESDPEESHNISGLEEYREIESSLRRKLVRWFSRYAEQYRDGRHLPVTGRGQLGPLSPLSDLRDPRELFSDDWSYVLSDPGKYHRQDF